jgi:hypothetical protein
MPAASPVALAGSWEWKVSSPSDSKRVQANRSYQGGENKEADGESGEGGLQLGGLYVIGGAFLAELADPALKHLALCDDRLLADEFFARIAIGLCGSNMPNLRD